MMWFKGLAVAQRIAIAVIAALLLIGAVMFVYDLFTASDKVEARLGDNTADAAIASGKDAVGTVGTQAEVEADRERDLSTAKGKVNEADDTASAHAAGSDFLCDNFGICAEE